MQTSTETDMKTLLHEFGSALRHALDSRIALSVEADASCPPCAAEAGTLESALMDLVIDARDAMPEGGALRLRAARCDDLPPTLAGDADGRHGWVSITVADSGRGRRLAEQSATAAPRARAHAGPRIAQVTRFARRCGGAVDVRAAPPEGTIVTLYLPAA